jgi:hypothetical protein
MRRAWGNKKPRIRCRVRGSSGVFRFVAYSPGHLPSARTSAGNKYKAKKKEAATETQLADRRKAVQVKAAMGGALRHVIERMSLRRRVSTLSRETFFLGRLDG